MVSSTIMTVLDFVQPINSTIRNLVHQMYESNRTFRNTWISMKLKHKYKDWNQIFDFTISTFTCPFTNIWPLSFSSGDKIFNTVEISIAKSIDGYNSNPCSLSHQMVWWGVLKGNHIKKVGNFYFWLLYCF